ncbi:hypothetical protein D3C76_1803800 [compost metagenome]
MWDQLHLHGLGDRLGAAVGVETDRHVPIDVFVVLPSLTHQTLVGTVERHARTDLVAGI